MFKNVFTKILKEELNAVNPQDADLDIDINDADAKDSAFKDTLDDGTDPSEFDVNPVSYRKITEENVRKAQEWAELFEQFAQKINSDEEIGEESFHRFINRVDREGSPFRGIVRSETKKVTRIAQELSSISETLRSYIIGSEKKSRELMQQFPNLEK
jgi:hypothetical protein